MLIKITSPNHGHGFDFFFVLTWWIEFENTKENTVNTGYPNCTLLASFGHLLPWMKNNLYKNLPWIMDWVTHFLSHREVTICVQPNSNCTSLKLVAKLIVNKIILNKNFIRAALHAQPQVKVDQSNCQMLYCVLISSTCEWMRFLPLELLSFCS